MAMPKFDISSQTDLLEGMKALGVTDVMDPSKSDFTPMTSELKELCLTQAEHNVRVAVDEEGVTAAAYSMMVVSETGAWVAEELDFVKTYIILERRSLGPDFHSELKIVKDVQPEQIRIPSMMIQIPVENAVMHALREKDCLL